MHTFGYTTVVKHEAWILVNQLVRQTDEVFRLCSSCDFSKSLFVGSRCDWLILSKSCVCRGVAVAVRRSEEWHQSLLKLKDKNASSKHLKNFKILFYFFCLFFVVLFFFSSSCCASSVKPSKQFGGEEVGKRPCVSFCDAWPLRILLVYLIFCRCLCIYVKCQIGCVQVQAWLCVLSVWVVDSSLHSEAAGLLHSRQQFLVKFLVRLVGRDVYPVKTGDRRGSLVTSNPTEI